MRLKSYFYRLLSFIPYFKRKMRDSILNSINNVVNSCMSRDQNHNLFTLNTGIFLYSNFNYHKIQYEVNYGDFEFNLYLEYEKGTIRKYSLNEFRSVTGKDLIRIGTYIDYFEGIPDNLFGNVFIELNKCV